MFHDVRELRAIGSQRPAAGPSHAVAAVEAFCNIGVEFGASVQKAVRPYPETVPQRRNAQGRQGRQPDNGGVRQRILSGHRAKCRGRSRHLGAFSARRQVRRVVRLIPGAVPRFRLPTYRPGAPCNISNRLADLSEHGASVAGPPPAGNLQRLRVRSDRMEHLRSKRVAASRTNCEPCFVPGRAAVQRWEDLLQKGHTVREAVIWPADGADRLRRRAACLGGHGRSQSQNSLYKPYASRFLASGYLQTQNIDPTVGIKF